MSKKRFVIQDSGGNRVDYDIEAGSVTLDSEGKSLPAKLAEIESTILGTADVVIRETEHYIDIEFLSEGISVSPSSIALTQTKTYEDLTVLGTHLSSAISAALSGDDASDFTLTGSLTAAGGTLRVAFNGDPTDDSITNLSAVLTLSSGSVTKTVNIGYSYATGPTISALPTTLSLKAAGGETDSATVAVSGISLEGNITAAITGADASKFQVNGSPITQSGGIASGNLTVIYSPAAGDDGPHEANLVLSSTNASPVTIPLAGAIAGTLSISPASANIGIPSGGSGTATFRVTGAHLTPGSSASVSIIGSNMAINKQTLTVQQNGTINEDVTVTFNGSAATNGTLSVSHTDVDTAAEATVTGAIVTPLPANASFTVDGIHYKVNSDQASVRVWNGSSESGAASTKYSGAVTIPASVSDSGVTANLDGGGTQAGVGCTYRVTSLATSAFGGCNNLTSLTLPEGLEKISMGAIRECKGSSFKSLAIPSTVKYIGYSFLWDCTYLETVDMRCYNNANWDSDNVNWGANNSGNCNKLTHLTSFKIPDGFVNYIGSSTYGNFYGCTALEEITLGKGLINFNDLFTQCTGVLRIYCRSTTPPTINASSSTTFSIPQSVYEAAQVYVPRGYKQAYLYAADKRAVNGTYPKMWDIFNTYHELIEYDPD